MIGIMLSYPNDVHILSPRTWKYVKLLDKRNEDLLLCYFESRKAILSRSIVDIMLAVEEILEGKVDVMLCKTILEGNC